MIETQKTLARDWELIPIKSSLRRKFAYDIYPSEFQKITGDLSLVMLSDPEFLKAKFGDQQVAPLIRRGATVGANATILCGVKLGRYAFVGAGAVVTRDVPDYGLVLGVPGRLIGFASRHGHKLNFEDSNQAVCPESGYRYYKDEDFVRCLDLDEQESLPKELAVGLKPYKAFRSKP